MSYFVLATINAKPGKGKDILAYLTKIKEFVDQGNEPGTKQYQPAVDQENPDKIHVWEEYDNAEAHEAHRQGQIYLEFKGKVSEWMTSPLIVQKLDRV